MDSSFGRIIIYTSTEAKREKKDLKRNLFMYNVGFAKKMKDKTMNDQSNSKVLNH